MPYANLGLIFFTLGSYDKAAEEARKQFLLRRNDGALHAPLGAVYQNLNRLGEAEAVYRQAEERKLESEGLLANRYLLAFLKGDPAQMALLAATAMGQAGHGRRAAGGAGGHGGLVWEVEERTRADLTGDGLSPAGRRQRDGRNVSGGRRRCARWNPAIGSGRAPTSRLH